MTQEDALKASELISSVAELNDAANKLIGLKPYGTISFCQSDQHFTYPILNTIGNGSKAIQEIEYKLADAFDTFRVESIKILREKRDHLIIELENL